MTTTWFITGSSRGLGRALTRAALEAGDSVAATARRPDSLDDLVAEFGERILPLPLDVTDADQARDAIAAATAHFGRLDVVVNNAGYANVAPIETADDADFRAQFDTNFWGVYTVTRAALPVFAEQGDGLFLQISSIGGRVGGSPGIGSYQAAKFAIDGFSRVLRAETRDLGIRVVVIEPSGFATDWAGASMTVHDVPSRYESTVGAMNSRMRQNTAGAAGDPDRAADIIVRLTRRADLPDNLALGTNATEMAVAAGTRQLASDEAWSAVSRSADFGAPFPVAFPA